MKSDVNVMPVAMTDMPPLDRAALGIVAASIPLRAVLALATDLTPDEAYYLSAARLGVTIQDHPPATVWMLQLMESLLKAGPIELRTRLPSLVLGTIGALLLVDIVRLRDGNAACQRWAAILSAWLVLPLAGGFLATPDALLFVATAALLHAEQQRSLRTAIASAAIAVLSGTLAKVIMAPIALAFVLASARRWPHRVVIATSLTLCLPLSFRSLAFQLHHAFAPLSWSAAAALVAAAAAIGGQLLLWTPIVLAVGLPALRQQPRVDSALALALLVLFLGSALVRCVPPESNWLAPAWCVLIVAAALALPSTSKATRFALIALGPALSLVAVTHALRPWLPIRRSADPTARLHGWSQPSGQPEGSGIGVYGIDAEACIYQQNCQDISLYFQHVNSEDIK